MQQGLPHIFVLLWTMPAQRKWCATWARRRRRMKKTVLTTGLGPKRRRIGNSIGRRGPRLDILNLEIHRANRFMERETMLNDTSSPCILHPRGRRPGANVLPHLTPTGLMANTRINITGIMGLVDISTKLVPRSRIHINRIRSLMILLAWIIILIGRIIKKQIEGVMGVCLGLISRSSMAIIQSCGNHDVRVTLTRMR